MLAWRLIGPPIRPSDVTHPHAFADTGTPPSLWVVLRYYDSRDACSAASMHLGSRKSPRSYESVPPKFYGGTERVVSYLTEELIRRHDVTLFASGDSKTSGKLYAGHSKCNRSSPCASFLDAL